MIVKLTMRCCSGFLSVMSTLIVFGLEFQTFLHTYHVTIFTRFVQHFTQNHLFFQAEAPVYWSVKEWCEGFKKLLDYMELDRVHLYGASLGEKNNYI